MFTIHKNIPAPIRRTGRVAAVFPFADLAVGDSFFVPVGESKPKTLKTRLQLSAGRWRKASGMTNVRFTFNESTDPMTGQPSMGVWRTK